MRDLQANEIKLAALEVPAGIDSDTAAATGAFIERAFIFGFRFLMLICAGLSLPSAAVAWRMIARPNLNNRLALLVDGHRLNLALDEVCKHN
jgi:hypothetical protein